MSKVQANFRLDESLLESLKSKAANEGVNTTDIVVKALQQYINGNTSGISLDSILDKQVRYLVDKRITEVTGQLGLILKTPPDDPADSGELLDDIEDSSGIFGIIDSIENYCGHHLVLAVTQAAGNLAPQGNQYNFSDAVDPEILWEAESVLVDLSDPKFVDAFETIIKKARQELHTDNTTECFILCSIETSQKPWCQDMNASMVSLNGDKLCLFHLTSQERDLDNFGKCFGHLGTIA